MSRLNKVIALLLIFALGFTVSQLTFKKSVEASSATTNTFAINRKGQFVITQNAYLPDRTIFDFGIADNVIWSLCCN